MAAVTECRSDDWPRWRWDFGSEFLQAGVLLFEAGFLLAGTVRPPALVCRWGRVFPASLPMVAGRRVPRWAVLGPALGLGAGMTAYFTADRHGEDYITTQRDVT